MAARAASADPAIGGLAANKTVPISLYRILIERPNGRDFCYGSRPHRSIAARGQTSATSHPLTPPSGGTSVMAASICIAWSPAKHHRAVCRRTAIIDVRASATDPVPFMRAVKTRATLQAAPRRFFTALIVKLKRTVNVVLVSQNALALASKAATLPLPICPLSPDTGSEQVGTEPLGFLCLPTTSSAFLASLPKRSVVLLPSKGCSHAAKQCES
jgi:hypothetical protein